MAGGFPVSGLVSSLAKPGLLSGGGGGALGGILGGLAKAAPGIGMAVSLVPSIYKTIAGISQANKAKKMNPQDPGFQMNQGILQNREIASNRYGNYQMPGYNRASAKIGSAYGTAFDTATRGASSSGDILDAATRLAYGQGQAISDLEVNNATGKEQALGQFMNANALAGNEAVKKNEYDRSIYQQKLREKAAMLQAGNENAYGGVDQLATGVGSLLNPKKAVTGGSGTSAGLNNLLMKYIQENGIQ